MSTVVLPGSFDPFTLGHLDLARRAATLADYVIIAVSHNPSKTGTLDAPTRQRTIDEVLAEHDLASTITTAVLPTGLLVDFCRDHGAHAVVRGLRNQMDLAYEESMARMNQHLTGLDTVFLLTSPEHAHISSSLVREVHALGGDVSDMLPTASLHALNAARGVS